MERIQDLPPRLRPREKLAFEGEDGLSEVELLSLLLGSGSGPALRLLAAFGSLQGIASRSLAELRTVPGVGPVRAGRILAAFELGRRTGGSPETLARFCRTEDVVRYFRPRLASLTHERLYLVLLDCRNRAFRIELIARGGLTGISVSPREILLPAIRESAAGLILVHNHPSGDPTPSESDRRLTDRVQAAAELLGLQLLDHVVVASGGHASLIG